MVEATQALTGLDTTALKFQDFTYKNGGSTVHSRLALSTGGEGGRGRFIGGLRSKPLFIYRTNFGLARLELKWS